MLNSGIAEEEGTAAVLALLTMALGCASQVIEGLTTGTTFSDEEMKKRASRKTMGDIYMDTALKKLYLVHMEVSSTATHCLFLVA